MKPRIELLGSEDAVARGARVGMPEALARLNIFRTLLGQPQLAGRVSDLLLTLLGGDHLDPRLRELVIMRIGWVSGAEYEWAQHWGIAQHLGLEANDLLGVRDWEAHPGFGPAERAAMAATDEVLRDGAISEATWDRCHRDVSGDPEVLLELLGAVCTWSMISVMLRSLDVPLDDDVERWPPDGAPGGPRP